MKKKLKIIQRNKPSYLIMRTCSYQTVKNKFGISFISFTIIKLSYLSHVTFYHLHYFRIYFESITVNAMMNSSHFTAKHVVNDFHTKSHNSFFVVNDEPIQTPFLDVVRRRGYLHDADILAIGTIIAVRNTQDELHYEATSGIEVRGSKPH